MCALIFFTANHHAIPEELFHMSYNHIGDIDVLDNIIYGGIEAREGNGVLAACIKFLILKFVIHLFLRACI